MTYGEFLDVVEADDARLVSVVVDARHDVVEVGDGRLVLADLIVLLLLSVILPHDAGIPDPPVHNTQAHR